MEQPLANDSEVEEGKDLTVDFFGRPVILTRKDGRVYAYVNVCTHLGGPVKREGDTFLCTWHGSTFDMESGEAQTPPAETGTKLIRLPIKIEGEKIIYVYP